MLNNYDNIAGSYDLLSRLVFFRSQVKAQIAQLKYIPEGSNVLIAGGGTGWILEEIAKIHPSGLSITYVEISAKMLEISQKRNTKANTITYVRSSIEDFKPEQHNASNKDSTAPTENNTPVSNNFRPPNNSSSADNNTSVSNNLRPLNNSSRTATENNTPVSNNLRPLNNSSSTEKNTPASNNFRPLDNSSSADNTDAVNSDSANLQTYDIIITAFLFDNFLPEKVNSVFTQLNSYLENGGRWLFCDFNYEENSGKKWQLYLLKTMYLFFRYIAHVEARSLTQTVQLFTHSGYTVENEAYYYKRFIKSVVYCKHEQG